MALLEIIYALLFVLSSGIFFHERFRHKRSLLVAAGLIALASSYFLFEEILARTIRNEIAKAAPPPNQPLRAAPAPVLNFHGTLEYEN